MIGTNRDLATIKEIVDCEINRLRHLATGTRDTAGIDRQLSVLYRQRLAVCAVLLNRRVEASKGIVDFSRWINGSGALDVLARSRSAIPRSKRDGDSESLFDLSRSKL